MHTLAFVNQKGGCGKTTTAVHLAGALARGARGPTTRGEGERPARWRSEPARVLVVDLDPQAHATMGLGCAVDRDATVADVLLHGTPPRDAIRVAAGGIELLPSCLRLAEFEEVADRVLHSEGFLRRALADVGDYDFVLIDCPPRADGVLTANALRAADTVVLVVETGAFALQGAFAAIEILEGVAAHMDTELDLRVVGTLYDRRIRIARELLIGAQARFGPLMFDTVIHESVRLREAPAFGVPVQVLDPDCRAVRDFDALAVEVRELARDHATTLRPPIPRAGASAEAHSRTRRRRTLQGVCETWTG